MLVKTVSVVLLALTLVRLGIYPRTVSDDLRSPSK